MGLDPRSSSPAIPPKDPSWEVGVLMMPLLGWWPVRGWGGWMRLHVLTVGGVRKAGRRRQCPYGPPKWHRIFTKSMRAVGGSALGPGRQVERVPAECEPGPPVGSRRERPCVSSLAPGRQARSRLHSVRRDSSWHQLQSGTMPGFLSFFLPFFKKF